MSDTPALAMTFDEFDALQRKPFALRLEIFMAFERTLVDGSLVVSLNAPFGSGKTAFLTMWENDLLSLRKRRMETAGGKKIEDDRDSGRSAPIPVRLNAWEDDFCGDPMVAIVSALTAALSAQKPKEVDAKNRKAILSTMEELARFAFLAGNQVVTNKIGVDLSETQKQAKAETRGEAMVPPASFVQAFHDRKKALGNLKKALNETFPGGGGANAIVFVDELDRCRPNYAVEYLETIKHVV